MAAQSLTETVLAHFPNRRSKIMTSDNQMTQEPTALKSRVMKGVKTMTTSKTLLCALLLSVVPVASVVRPVAAVGQTDLYGSIGRGSPLNPGALITVDQHTGLGTLVGHPDSVPGLTGLVFDISGTLYGTTISGMLGTGRFSTLVRIDPSTGAQIGSAVNITANDLPISITDLTLQPGTNKLYGTSLSEDDFINSIYTIDPATGVATLIGRTGVIGATIAFGPDGTLYQSSAIFDDVGFVAGFLNTLDPNTGAVLTTSDPFTQAHVGGLTVRPTDGVIFASGGDQGDIYTLSPTGTQTLVGFTSAGGVGDLAFTPLPTSKADCKNGAWQRFSFPFSFKNQGDCIQFVNTGK
jgi:hypothetical protein